MIPSSPANRENETTMHENPTHSWTSLAEDSRRARGFACQTSRRAAEAAVRNQAAELGDELLAGGNRFH